MGLEKVKAKLLAYFGEERLKREIQAKIEEFHGLLTEEGAIRLLWKEVERKPFPIADLEDGDEMVCIEGRVVAISPLFNYYGRKRKEIELKDKSGKIAVVLRGKRISLANTLLIGDVLRVEFATVRNGKLELGYVGEIKVKERAPLLTQLPHSPGLYNLLGRVEKREGSWYLKLEGERAPIFFDTTDRRSTLLKPEMLLRAEGVRVEEGKVFVLRGSRLLVKRKRESMAEGTIREIKALGDKLEIALSNGERVELNEDESRLFLGIEQSPDILLSTGIELKKRFLIGKKIRFFKEGDKVLYEVIE